MMNLKAKNMLTKAKIKIILAEPFWASLLLKLEFEEDVSAATMWTDGKRVGYNPDFAMGLSSEELIGVLAHEVGHCILLHMTRRGGRDGCRWNMACDYSLNHLIENAGFTLPSKRLRRPEYDGFSCEKVYDLLPEESPSGYSSADPGGCGEVREGPGGLEKERLSAEWKVAAAAAAATARMHGKLPGELDRVLEGILKPRISMAELLNRFVTEVTRNDFCWTSPNRRYVSQGVYLPSLHRPDIGEIILMVDTSGSIGIDDLKFAAGILQAILAAANKGFTILYVDEKVSGVQEIDPEEPLSLKPTGGGGTDFRPGYRWIRQKDRQPAGVIYITDGCCDTFPKREPAFPTLWLLNRENPGFRPPWGEVVVAG